MISGGRGHLWNQLQDNRYPPPSRARWNVSSEVSITVTSAMWRLQRARARLVMFRIVVLAIAMLLIGAALALSESSEGIRIVSARDLLNYAEMPTFRDAVLDRIRHTENGVSWGIVVSKKDLYCTPHSLPLAPEQILTIMGRYTKDNSTEVDRNWELVMINALKNVFPCVDATRG